MHPCVHDMRHACLCHKLLPRCLLGMGKLHACAVKLDIASLSQVLRCAGVGCDRNRPLHIAVLYLLLYCMACNLRNVCPQYMCQSLVCCSVAVAHTAAGHLSCMFLLHRTSSSEARAAHHVRLGCTHVSDAQPGLACLQALLPLAARCNGDSVERGIALGCLSPGIWGHRVHSSEAIQASGQADTRTKSE